MRPRTSRARAFEVAWNTLDRDPGLRRPVTDDIDWADVDAGWGKRIEQIVSGHAQVHEVKHKESVMTLGNVGVAPVTQKAAIVHVKWTVRGDRNNDVSAREPREGMVTWTTVRAGDAWKIR